MNAVQCYLDSSSLKHNVQFDPFEDEYIRTILQLDRKALMEIPILDDDTFISQMNNIVNVSVALRNPTGIADSQLDDELLSQRDIEQTWEELVVAGPITVNYI
ncbi:unnamed protein product, partial [Adineta steineri]